ncbi:MAG: DUF6766 family protein [Specibacter sp.]
MFIVALAGQALTGHALSNQEQLTAGLDSISWGQYLPSSSFGVGVAENRQSQYLQFLLYIGATMWLVQRVPRIQGTRQGGAGFVQGPVGGQGRASRLPGLGQKHRMAPASHRQFAGVGQGIFVSSRFAQSVAESSAYNEQQLQNLLAPITWAGHAASPEFRNRLLQNWQSAFLAVGSMVVLSIYLRPRGYPESKPVGSAHDTTGATG